ncbi:glycosyltransferase [Rubrivivax gelatinosus]|uniref:glycosyltransferase n=1 Tax=Rubrivivax gelatinosus TaxID=28068 RepID=UPI0019052C1B|nr:glycosyltransferase [Rubrivivax gelatinosus]
MSERPASGTVLPTFRALADLLQAARPASKGRRRAMILLTGYGGHEQMLLRHMAADPATEWDIVAAAEEPTHLARLSQALPSNVRLSDTVLLPAYPSLLGTALVRATLSARRFLGREIGEFDLVSAGDIGNFAYLTAMVRLSAARPPITYVPMPPRQRNRATQLGRWAATRLATISPTEAAGFGPPADYVLRNMAPGHLSRLQSEGLDDGHLNLYWIGRLERNQKCPERALAILALLHARGLAHAVLHFVGDGEERSALQARVREHSPQGAVCFWGWVDFEAETLPPLPRMHALLNTSNFEGIPLTLLDALDIGIPCLVREGAISDPELAAQVVGWRTEHEAADWIADHCAPEEAARHG